ncbi:MAG: FAD-dependent monooxygenase [Pseudonocardiaceae bacterium]
MNTAIHGAYDLGWKLAWVLRGWADPVLLDTYETERRPVAAHNVARSADPLGGSRTLNALSGWVDSRTELQPNGSVQAMSRSAALTKADLSG